MPDKPEDVVSVRTEVMKQGAHRRRLQVRVAALVGAGLVAALVYDYVSRRAEENAARERRERAALAWANVQQCLVGDRLTDIVSPAARIRRIELAGNDPKKEGAWPRACATHMTELYGSLEDLGFGSELRQQLRERFACDSACNPNDPGVQLVSLLDASLTAPLDVVEPTVAAPTMVSDALIDKETMAQIAYGDARIRARDFLVDGRARYLFASRKRGTTLCEVSPDAEPPIRCGGLTIPISGSTATLLLDTAEPIISGRSNENADDQAFDRHGNALATHEGVHEGFTLRPDSGTAFVVAHVERGEVVADRRVELSKSASPPLLVDDALMWTAVEEGERRLNALMLSVAEGKIRSERKTLGAAANIKGAPQVCRAGKRTALLFGQSTATWSLVFRGEDGFSSVVPVEMKDRLKAPSTPKVAPPAPKKAETERERRLREASEFGMATLRGTEEGSSPWAVDDDERRKPSALERDLFPDQLGLLDRRERAPLPRYAFTCGDDAAHLTWRSPHGDAQLIQHLRCTENGCTHERVVLPDLDVRTWWTASTLQGDDDQILLVWRDGTGLLKRRLAPIAELASAKDALIMDSADHGGPTTLDLEAVFGRRATVFVFRGKGFHALRIDAEGSTALTP